MDDSKLLVVRREKGDPSLRQFQKVTRNSLFHGDELNRNSKDRPILELIETLPPLSKRHPVF
jgi:hypothetical protein